MELFLYAPCEEEIQSSILASVYFVDFTNVNELQDLITELTVFPNAASESITLSFDLIQQANVGVEIYDLVGKLHKLSTLEPRTTGKQQQTIDVSQLPVGVYLMKIQIGDSGFLMQRLVISH